MKIIGFFTLMILMCFGEAYAFSYLSCNNGNAHKWYNNGFTTYYAPVSFDNSPYLNSITNAANKINKNPSKAWMALKRGDNNVGHNNGYSEVWYNPSVNGSAYSINFTNNNCWIQENDVVFYQRNWTPNMNHGSHISYSGQSIPMETTAVHEFGHSLGLGHTSNRYSIMGTDWTHITKNGSVIESYLGEDASAGLLNLYGVYYNNNNNTFEDVSVSHWQYVSTSGEYSVHGKTPIQNTNGYNLSSFFASGNTHYNVNRGQTVRAWFNYDNNGANTQEVNASYYLSNNDYISTSDYYLFTHSITLNRNYSNLWSDGPVLLYTDVYIPTNITTGYKYLGVILSPKNNISEVSTSNNSAHIGLYVN